MKKNEEGRREGRGIGRKERRKEGRNKERCRYSEQNVGEVLAQGHSRKQWGFWW